MICSQHVVLEELRVVRVLSVMAHVCAMCIGGRGLKQQAVHGGKVQHASVDGQL